mmetsp:Transcript_17932/g.37075  ORF Transcript_17932/g.37075 Transcript_17932/m.37075 type:complete len:200 (-) Transcript_17932:49-648(-)
MRRMGAAGVESSLSQPPPPQPLSYALAARRVHDSSTAATHHRPLTVVDLLNPRVPTVHPHTQMSDAASLMVRENMTQVPIVTELDIHQEQNKQSPSFLGLLQIEVHVLHDFLYIVRNLPPSDFAQQQREAAKAKPSREAIAESTPPPDTNPSQDLEEDDDDETDNDDDNDEGYDSALDEDEGPPNGIVAAAAAPKGVPK